MPTFRVPLIRTTTEREWAEVVVETDDAEGAIDAALTLAKTGDLNWGDRGVECVREEIDVDDWVEIVTERDKPEGGA